MIFWKRHKDDYTIAKKSRTSVKAVADDGSKYNCIKIYILSVVRVTTTAVNTALGSSYTCCLQFGMFTNPLQGACDGPDCVLGVVFTPPFGVLRFLTYCDGVYESHIGHSGTGGEISVTDCEPHGWQADTLYIPSVASPTSTEACFTRVDTICYPDYPTSPLNSCNTTTSIVPEDYEAGGPCRDLIPDFWDGFSDCVPSVLS